MSRFHTTVYVRKGRKPINVYADSKKELKDKVNCIKAELIQRKYETLSGNFGEWADKWFEEIIVPQLNSGNLKSQTVDTYRSCLKHLTDRFGKSKLCKITLSDFQTFINGLAKCNPNTKKPTSKKTIRDVVQVWDRVTHYAELNYVKIPNFRKSDVINNGNAEVKREALTLSEQDMIINTPHRIQPAAMIMMFAGLRKSEVGALKWDAIDFEHNIIEVRQSVSFDKSRPTVKSGGKSTAAKRIIPIMPILRDYLLEFKKQNNITGGYVTIDKYGKIFSKSTWKKVWNSYLDDLNLKYGYGGKKPKWRNEKYPFKIRRFTPHCLRHTFATILYLEGFNAMTSMQLLGHSDIKTTVNVYTDMKNFNIYSLPESYRERLKKEYLIPKDLD